jgi:phospholipid transport system transporter-binding protein
MQKHAALTFHDSIFQISGDLCHQNVMSLHRQSLAYFESTSQLTFDFAGVTSSDSAGLALVIEWIKLAEQHKKPIHIKNLSDGLMSIAVASGLDPLILNRA